MGGIHYPSHVIPSWIGQLAAVVPLTYGLRALRQLFLAGQPIAAVAGDLAVLAAFATVLLAVSWSREPLEDGLRLARVQPCPLREVAVRRRAERRQKTLRQLDARLAGVAAFCGGSH